MTCQICFTQRAWWHGLRGRPVESGAKVEVGIACPRAFALEKYTGRARLVCLQACGHLNTRRAHSGLAHPDSKGAEAMVACQPAVEQSLGFRHIIQHWGRKYTCMEADLLSYKGGSSVEQWG